MTITIIIPVKPGGQVKALGALRLAGVDIRNFELQRPTLEEIFLAAVRGGAES